MLQFSNLLRIVITGYLPALTLPQKSRSTGQKDRLVFVELLNRCSSCSELN